MSKHGESSQSILRFATKGGRERRNVWRRTELDTQDDTRTQVRGEQARQRAGRGTRVTEASTAEALGVRAPVSAGVGGW